MKITVLSGKGGTGKTTVATNLALSLSNCQLLDADVEEPDSYIFIHPTFEKEYEPVLKKIPVIDDDKCTACRRCVDFCQFNALALVLDRVITFPELCHSCGGCMQICPEQAIKEEKREVGKIRKDISDSQLEFWQGELNIGEEKAVPVIAQLKTHIDEKKIVIIDAQPGTTCPTIEAAIDSDYCLLVTEPTPFGLNDLEMAVDMLKELNMTIGVIINRSEEKYDRIIEDYCNKENIPVLLKIPFDRKIAELYSEGIPFTEKIDGWKERFQDLYLKIEELARL